MRFPLIQPALVRRLAIVATMAAGGGALRAQSVSAQLRAIDSAWTRSYAVHDTVLAKEIMAPDIVITSPRGVIKDRAAELKDVAEFPGLTLHFFRSSGVSVQERGAVVTGLLEWEWTMNERRTLTKLRYTATYARGGPRGWQLVALHLGPAPQ